jgi:hypothetical protein
MNMTSLQAAEAPDATALLRRRARWLVVGRTDAWLDAAREWLTHLPGALPAWRARTGLLKVVPQADLALALREALAAAPARLTLACEPDLRDWAERQLLREVPQHLAPPTGADLRVCEAEPPFDNLMLNLLMPEPGLSHLWLQDAWAPWPVLAARHLQLLHAEPDAPALPGDPVAMAAAAQLALEGWARELTSTVGSDNLAELRAQADALVLQALPDPEDADPLPLAPPDIKSLGLPGRLAAQGSAEAPGQRWQGQLPAQPPLPALTFAVSLRRAGRATHLHVDLHADQGDSSLADGGALSLAVHAPGGPSWVLRGRWARQPDGSLRAELSRPLSGADSDHLHSDLRVTIY